MAKITKEQQWRMEGYVAALRYAKEHGLEELEKDVRLRGFLSIPVGIGKKECDHFLLQISTNLTQTMAAVMLMVLHDQLGFRTKRLKRIKKKFDEMTETIFDFTELGNHYVTLEDYAVFLNENYGLGLDVERIASCQDTCKYEKENVHMAKIDSVIRILKENGFEDAGAFLEGKVD